MYFRFIAHLNLDQPRVKGSVVTHGDWPLYCLLGILLANEIEGLLSNPLSVS